MIMLEKLNRLMAEGYTELAATPRLAPCPAPCQHPGMPILATALIYALAALAEIAGCFAFWAWIRNGQPAWWLVPGGRASWRWHCSPGC